MFKVYENNKPARYPEQNVSPSWKNNEFNTLIEAQQYLDKWLGIYSPGVTNLRLNIPFILYEIPFEIRQEF
jgi:hypothetical protein